MWKDTGPPAQSVPVHTERLNSRPPSASSLKPKTVGNLLSCSASGCRGLSGGGSYPRSRAASRSTPGDTSAPTAVNRGPESSEPDGPEV